jgi:predicted ATPase
MSPAQIAAQIQHDLDFLAASWRDVPERHRSIRALFEHSWRLLTDTEHNILMKLSVFRGGFDADAAQFVAGASLLDLASLEDKSLVRAHASGRYDLHPLIRQYTEKHLHESGLLGAVCTAYVNYFITWAEHANEKIRGGEQLDWTRRIITEYDNLRAALNRVWN